MSRNTHRRIAAWLLAVVGAFAVGVLASWMLWSLTMDGSGTGTGDGDLVAGDESFTISGDLAEPVSPGVAVPLDLTIVNAHEHPLIVTDVTVTVEAVDAPHATEARPCDTDDFAVVQISTASALRVEAGTSRSLADLGMEPEEWPQVGMIDTATNQDGCKAASLELAYTATGRLDR
jgi:hypothetical protein